MTPKTTSPDASYYAVIFTNQRKGVDNDGYAEAAARMEDLARTMPGYLGFESARNQDGFGIAVSYWRSEEAIRNWKAQAAHMEAQKRGREDWYKDYKVRVAKIERVYDMKQVQEKQ